MEPQNQNMQNPGIGAEEMNSGMQSLEMGGAPGAEMPVQNMTLEAKSQDVGKKCKHLPIMIGLGVVALIGIIFGIVGMVLNGQSMQKVEELEKKIEQLEKEEIAVVPEEDYTMSDFEDVYGEWLTNGGTYFSFDDNGTFYWWASPDELDDNYYFGDLEIFQGDDAIEVLDTDYESVLEIATRSEGKIGLDDIYALKLYPTYLISGGIDKTDTLATNFPKGNDYMLLSFIVVDEGVAQAYNYSSGDTYYMERESL